MTFCIDMTVMARRLDKKKNLLAKHRMFKFWRWQQSHGHGYQTSELAEEQIVGPWVVLSKT